MVLNRIHYFMQDKLKYKRRNAASPINQNDIKNTESFLFKVNLVSTLELLVLFLFNVTVRQQSIVVWSYCHHINIFPNQNYFRRSFIKFSYKGTI
jgi:hypothetical protein